MAEQDGVLTDEEEFLHGTLVEVTPPPEDTVPDEDEKAVPTNEEMPELYTEEPEEPVAAEEEEPSFPKAGTTGVGPTVLIWLLKRMSIFIHYLPNQRL